MTTPAKHPSTNQSRKELTRLRLQACEEKSAKLLRDVRQIIAEMPWSDWRNKEMRIIATFKKQPWFDEQN